MLTPYPSGEQLHAIATDFGSGPETDLLLGVAGITWERVAASFRATLTGEDSRAQIRESAGYFVAAYSFALVDTQAAALDRIGVAL